MEKNEAAAVIGPETDDRQQEARERFWQAAERIRAHNQDKDPDAELVYITEVVEEVRKEWFERERRDRG
ncbi:MAG: hypothetical protein M3464_22655 [Chloroflexota bacterium]|nr:hypothetical protein [Chloroflexota bacterium]